MSEVALEIAGGLVEPLARADLSYVNIFWHGSCIYDLRVMERSFGTLLAREQNENENQYQKGLGAYAKKLSKESFG